MTCLVATALIENGLDIPRANTIIVNHAERFGLADLYQLRGRVGRSNRRAYAYFLVAAEESLTPIARRRLAALKEFSELGSGFRLAALDLELRGAGNLLGAEQHGHLNAIGIDLYLKMLEQTVEELKGGPQKVEVRTTLNLGLDIKIPDSYIADESQRLRMYKRISSLAARKRAVAGMFYPKDPSHLGQLLEGFFTRTVPGQNALGIVSPHAGYIYSGQIGVPCFPVSRPVFCTFVVIGPSHHGYLTSVSA